MTLNLEFFYSPYCSRCHKTRVQMQALSASWSQEGVRFREINVLEDLDRAVAVGVLQTPALAIDGRLVGGGITSPKALEKLLRQQLHGARAK